MGRPKGSKNKQKEIVTECEPLASVVEKKSRRTRRTKIREEITLESQELSKAKKSRRSSVKTVAKQTEDTYGQENSSQKVIVGWANLQKYPDSALYRNNYYTGADIHKTIEDARKYASKYTVGQFFISCEVKE